jgi:hypothetical protein
MGDYERSLCFWEMVNTDDYICEWASALVRRGRGGPGPRRRVRRQRAPVLYLLECECALLLTLADREDESRIRGERLVGRPR